MRPAWLLVALAAGCASAEQSSDGPAGDLAQATDGGGGDLLAAPAVLADVTVTPATVAAGRAFAVAAVFSGKNLGQQPIHVQFSSTAPATASVQAGADLAFNQAQAQVMGAALTVGDATISATAGGVTRTAVVHVVPSVSGLAPSPLRVRVGTQAPLTVTLSAPATAAGADVALASADPKVATVPASLHVDAGMTTATAMVTAVAAGGPASITASYAGSMQSAPVLAIDPVERLAISEVLYDAAGADDGYEWIELWNGGNAAVDLSGYFIAVTASSNTPDYTAASPSLSGILQPGDCAVVGGPTADPNANALTVNFGFLDAVKFNPALPNGTVTTAEGVALYQGSPQSIGQATIVDAVIYGTMQRGIAD